MTGATPNDRLREWRENADLTRAEMAKMVNLSRSGIKHGLTCDEERIRRWEAGEVLWPHEPYRQAIKDVTHRDPEDLGFIPRRSGPAKKPAQPRPREVDNQGTAPRTMDLVGQGEAEDDVRRREFVGLTGAALFTAVLGQQESAAAAGRHIESLAAVLVDYSPPNDGPIDLAALSSAVIAAKQDYQACRYAQVTAALPALLQSLRAACSVLDGDGRLRAYALSAEAHHVAASILLKQEDKGLAWLAADRSVQAAHASQSPLMIGS
ncbi:helix-turn-helix transcriptional regulator, partial [Nonomuraea rhizosphaerae]|uniref:helix-turn-helix transcriptional regulator n=1 Tax=Nonomuraea rhizosphaerae TaxID=2665663 RepID=UPI001C5FAF60